MLKTDLNLRAVAPKTWSNPDEHFNMAITHIWYKLILQISGTICYATQDFFRQKNYLPALMPITTESVTSPMGFSSDSLPVSVSLFDRQTYLADSMQFHLEYLLRQHKEGVFYIMPTFRGEDSDARHLNQFFHIEAELSTDLKGLIKTIESLISHSVKEVIAKHNEELESHGFQLDHLQDFIQKSIVGIPQIRFDDTISVLGEDSKYFNTLNNYKIGLTNLAETRLIEYFHGPVWVTHLPRLGVPFYQANAEDGRNALCADLLIGIGETVGCGERHVTYESTIDALKERQISAETYQWYLQMKKDFPMQSSGFGIGLERLLLWILKHDDIRDIPLIVRLKELTSKP